MALKKIMCFILLVTLSVLCIASCAPQTQEPPVQKTIEKIEYVNGSINTTIKVGDALNTANLKIKVTYTDGSTEQISSDKLTIGRIDTGVAGTKKLSVEYEGFKISIDVLVEATALPSEPRVTGISDIKGFPTALSIGDSFSTAGITAKVSFDNGTSKTLGVSNGLIVSGDTVDTSKGGTYYVTVSYGGFVATPVAVTVSASLTGIEVDENSIKTVYYQNDEVDLSNIAVYAVYNDGSKKLITDASALVVDAAAVTTDTLGERSFTVTYTTGAQTYTDTVEYSVIKKIARIEVDESSITTAVLMGDTVDTSRIIVNVIYTDDSQDQIGYADVQVGYVNTSTTGEKTLTVRYGDFSDTVTITVAAKLSGIAYRGKALSFIHVVDGSDNNPEVTADKFAQYIANGDVVIELVYDKGNGEYVRELKTISSLDEIEYDGLDTSSTTERSYIHVYYKGFDADVEYSVVKYLDRITLSEANEFVARIGHYDDSEAALAGIAMTAVYSNGDTKELAIDDLAITGFSTDTVVASADMTVTYSDEFGTASVPVTYEIYKKFASLEFADSNYPTVYKPSATVSTATQISANVVYSDGTKDAVIATLNEFTLDTATTEGINETVTFYYVDADGITREGSVIVEVLKVASLTVGGVDTYVPYWVSASEPEAGYVEALINAANVNVLVTFEDRFGQQSTEALGTDGLVLTHNIDIKTMATYTANVQTPLYGTATVDITVGRELASIEVIGGTTSYFQGGEINLGNLVLKATYHDGFEVEIEYADVSEQITADGFNTSEVGSGFKHTVTYTENEVTASTELTYTVYESYDPETTQFGFTTTTATIEIGDAYNAENYGTFIVNGVNVVADADYVLDCSYNAENPRAGYYRVVVSYRGLTSEMLLKVVIEITDGSGDNVTDK